MNHTFLTKTNNDIEFHELSGSIHQTKYVPYYLLCCIKHYFLVQYNEKVFLGILHKTAVLLGLYKISKNKSRTFCNFLCCTKNKTQVEQKKDEMFLQLTKISVSTFLI